MAQPKKNQAPQTTRGKNEAKLLKATGQEVVDGINSSNEEECKAKLALLATYENETEKEKKENEDIKRLASELKDLKAPYKETLGGIKLQRQAIGFRLEELGRG